MPFSFDFIKQRPITERDYVDKVSFLLAISLLCVSLIIILIMITQMNKEISEPRVVYNTPKQKTPKIQYTKISKQYKLVKNEKNEVVVDEETEVESNVKDNDFNDLVTTVVEKSAVKNFCS